MAHITKFKMTAMPQMFAHINRDRDTVSKYSNQEIDPSKTHLNTELVQGDLQKLQKRLDEVSHTHRKDLVVCVGVVITLPDELKNAENERQQSFFTECHNFLSCKFGENNTVYSVAHFDETTPHLHFGFVPVVEKERKYRSKAKQGQTYTEKRICVHDVVTKPMLCSFHDELQAHIAKTFPDVRIVAEDKAHRMKQSKSIAELKEETKKRMEQKEKQLDQVCWEAKIWARVAEDNGKTSNAVRDKAYQDAEEIRQNARRIGRDDAERIRQEAYQDASREADQIKKKAMPELYEEFKQDIEAVEQENARLRDENQRLHHLLEKAKKGLSALWGLFVKKKLFLKVPPEAVHELTPMISDCENHGLLEKQEAKQEVQEQKPVARVWDEVKKSKGITR